MKKFFLFGIIGSLVLFFASCSQTMDGELVGVNRTGRYFEPIPYGMTYISRGSFNMGPSDQDITSALSPNRTVTVESFWMDETEITNNEYRQFVYWVRDSLARRLLGESDADSYLVSEDESGNPIDPPRLNWDTKIDWSEPDNQVALEDLYYKESDRIFGKKALDPHKLVFEFFWVDLKQAAKRENSYNPTAKKYEGTVYDLEGKQVPIEGRSSFIMNNKVLVYPDTLCWIRDYTYSYNEPRATTYFYHPGFDDYPVVGVTWKQARAFCAWRTHFKNESLQNDGQESVQAYRLPSEAEWEFAARGGLEHSMYPWGGVYTRNDEGCFLANFKPVRGNYTDDNGMTTTKVAKYDPNGYGLYDMAGNVAEWTISAYDEATYNFMHDANPNYEYNALPDDPPALKRKVIRGGSWKDIAYFLQVGTRTFEYQDTAKSYIGFRCVRSSFGDEF
ncbi:SUMF1/EgtB/PvdO family nonheme iron enzyme [Halosquirtibacter laminarini]|uniref:SUMF1/EgtB/PvdO family nonheme iron enzyme n=1 Tax=Halosquirtibacter laminarini TaxID=3374600 RepID=A0AC61NMW3_9BACT|nr:SUMF1/EgtB/PvdO family nonheme iron enzyme [Prolixibacteraceae bacterium]